MRFIMNGFFDRAQVAGPVTGSGPGYEQAIAKFEARQKGLASIGKWRKAPAKWKQNRGKFIDPEWVIIDYGQNP
jgi:hypothetical protein